MRDGLVPARRVASLMRGPLDALLQRSALVVVIGLLLVAFAARGALAEMDPSGFVGWGRNDVGQAEPPIPADSGVVAIAAGSQLVTGTLQLVDGRANRVDFVSVGHGTSLGGLIPNLSARFPHPSTTPHPTRQNVAILHIPFFFSYIVNFCDKAA